MGALIEDVQFTQRIEFPAKAENIALAEKLIDEACQKHNVRTNRTMATSSSPSPRRWTNAIHHGNRLDPAKQVTMGYEVKDDKIVFVVSDQGPGFDFEHLPRPTDPENIEKPHGRGILPSCAHWPTAWSSMTTGPRWPWR